MAGASPRAALPVTAGFVDVTATVVVGLSVVLVDGTVVGAGGVVVAGGLVVVWTGAAVVGVGVTAPSSTSVVVLVPEAAVSDVADSGAASLAPQAVRVKATATPRDVSRRRECCTGLTVLAEVIALVARLHGEMPRRSLSVRM